MRGVNLTDLIIANRTLKIIFRADEGAHVIPKPLECHVMNSSASSNFEALFSDIHNIIKIKSLSSRCKKS